MAKSRNRKLSNNNKKKTRPTRTDGRKSSKIAEWVKIISYVFGFFIILAVILLLIMGKITPNKISVPGVEFLFVTPTPTFTQTPTSTQTSTPTPTKTPTEIVIQVFSLNYPFEDTHIKIEEGDTIEFTVLGENPTWYCGRDIPTGPEGFYDEKYADTVFTQANACALIGSISTSEPQKYFLVGAQSTYTAEETGILFLGCNDSKERFIDNPSDSNLAVKITVKD